MPGKASTLLIWFGKSERPVATTRAYFNALAELEPDASSADLRAIVAKPDDQAAADRLSAAADALGLLRPAPIPAAGGDCGDDGADPGSFVEQLDRRLAALEALQGLSERAEGLRAAARAKDEARLFAGRGAAPDLGAAGGAKVTAVHVEETTGPKLDEAATLMFTRTGHR